MVLNLLCSVHPGKIARLDTSGNISKHELPVQNTIYIHATERIVTFQYNSVTLTKSCLVDTKNRILNTVLTYSQDDRGTPLKETNEPLAHRKPNVKPVLF